jgi:hypothetical protein
MGVRQMANNDYDFHDSALIGHLVSVSLLAKLVERHLISPDDAADLIDEALLKLEEWQGHFPDHQPYFQTARDYLSECVAAYRSTPKKPPDQSP